MHSAAVFYYPEATFWTNKQVLFNFADPPLPPPLLKKFTLIHFSTKLSLKENKRKAKKSILYFFCPIFRVEVNLAMWKT
jgi:hypothetical protein